MKAYERNITRFFQSRFGSLVLTLIAMIAIVVAYCCADVPVLPPSQSPFPGMLYFGISDPLWSLGASLLLMCGSMLILSIINGVFNLLRSTTLLFVGLYAVMQAATPLVSVHFTGGLVLNFVMMMALTLMYTTYMNAERNKRVFLAFFIVAFGGMALYAFTPYLLVLLVGCAQMRCLRLRSFIAAILGIVTPLWLMWGFGVVSIDMLQPPHFSSIFEHLDSPDTTHLLITASITIIASLIITLGNLVKVYNFNARMRAFNGLFATITLATILLCVVDYGNIIAYMPLLNCCTAMQVTLMFRIRGGRSYLPVLLLLIAYAGLYIWSLWI